MNLINTPIIKTGIDIELEIVTDAGYLLSSKKPLPVVPTVQFLQVDLDMINEIFKAEIEAFDSYVEGFEQWLKEGIWETIKHHFGQGMTKMEVILKMNSSKELIKDYGLWEYTNKLINHRAKQLGK